MTSKERVKGALQRKPVDRIPIYMWYHPETEKKLSNSLEIPREYFVDVIGDDIRQTWVNDNYALAGITHENEGETHLDFWGVKWIKKGSFNHVVEYPLLKASRNEILNYQFPIEHIDELMDLMNPLIQYNKEYFIGCDISPCIIEMYNRLRGMENGLMDMVLDPELTEEFFRKSVDFCILLINTVSKRFHPDWIWTGDDVGGQNAMLMNPDLWRNMIKPHLKKIIETAKSKGHWVAYHSDGAIRPIIPDLIEIGVDVLNPIQCNCPGMDPLDLKIEFGKDLSFMGGLDTQILLPNGTTEEVRQATEKLIDGMTRDGGGYILAASHFIPPETPVDNIFIIYEVAGISKEEIFDRAAQIRNKFSQK